MKKQKVNYQLRRYASGMLVAKREISFELKLSSRLILDELCFNWNKDRLYQAINLSIDMNDEAEFMKLSAEYKRYI